MNLTELRQLLDAVGDGTVDASAASDRILHALRAAPLDDLGYARVDTHRHYRQGFPEVVFGVGKTPAQIAAIAERIIAGRHSLLVTRATPEAFTAVRAVAPDATYHAEARAITRSAGDVLPGKGTILIACAGTSDLPVAEEAAVTAELMGNVVDRLYDVGVAGIHRLLRERDRLQSARVIIVVAGMGEAQLVTAIASETEPPVHEAEDCARALQRARYERERGAVQREIDRLQQLGATEHGDAINALWARKQDLLRRITELS